MLVLAGDVGGTKTHLALFDMERPGALPPPRDQTRFPSQDAPGLADLVAAFLKRTGAAPQAACFGVAGPVVRGKVHTVNLPWDVETAQMKSALGFDKVAVLNDLEATAYGVGHLGPSQLRTLQPGEPDPERNAAVIAAGTGLGESLLVRAAGRAIAVATEGGHTDFAPIDDEQIALLRDLREKEGRVSYERIVAGPGIARVYEHLRRASGEPETAEVTRRLSEASDRSAAISALALEGSDPVAVKTLRLFARVYGSEAGNLALRSLSFAGLFIAGGIAPKVLPFLEDASFLEAFRAKGRLADLMKRFPVHVVLEESCALLGAAAYGGTL
ncbi:MAG TPA: glucokinase [Planctomycetota bacterium]|nr:glucokinase [Planctomycetota bacterium]